MELSDFSLYYKVHDNKVFITGYNGLASSIAIPEQIEGFPVAVIEKKAFLSKKNLRRVLLPDTVEEVEDWGFAYCNQLKEIRVPGKRIRFGKSVFLECSSLEQISVSQKTDTGTCFPSYLLAAAVTDFDAYYLLDIEAAGDEEWLAKWDSRMLTILHAPDTEGYSRQVLCGEEDYGSTDLGVYISGKRRQKAKLALLRLQFSQGLSAESRKELEQYLLWHTKGCESEEAWKVVLEDYGDQKEYYSLFAELGCVTSENLDGILIDIGEEHPEMKAYFLGMGQSDSAAEDFFDSLEL